MKYFQKLTGAKCYLSPVSGDDAERCTEWLNDFEVAANLNILTQIISLESEKKWLESVQLKQDYVFAIILREQEKMIGTTGLTKINYIDRCAEFGIFIGDKNHWNRGIGTEAAQLTLDFAFNVLNLKNVMLKVFSYNKRAIKSYEKAGFKLIGSRRCAKIIAGEYYDDVYMDVLADEFESPFIKKQFEQIRIGKSQISLAGDDLLL